MSPAAHTRGSAFRKRTRNRRADSAPIATPKIPAKTVTMPKMSDILSTMENTLFNLKERRWKMQKKHDLYLCVSGALSCCAMAAFTMYVGAQKDKAPATNATHVKPSVENIKLLLQHEKKHRGTAERLNFYSKSKANFFRRYPMS